MLDMVFTFLLVCQETISNVETITTYTHFTLPFVVHVWLFLSYVLGFMIGFFKVVAMVVNGFDVLLSPTNDSIRLVGMTCGLLVGGISFDLKVTSYYPE